MVYLFLSNALYQYATMRLYFDGFMMKWNSVKVLVAFLSLGGGY